MNMVDDRTPLQILEDSGIVDTVISGLRERYLSVIANSMEHETKLRETVYFKLRMLQELRGEFQHLFNKELTNIDDEEEEVA